MGEIGLHCRQLLRTLREARYAVQSELDMQAETHPLDRALLEHLQTSARELAGQADMLLATMQDQSADQALLNEAEEIAGFFHAAEVQIMFLVGAGRGFG